MRCKQRKSNSAYQTIVKTPGGIGTVSEKDVGEYAARLREYRVPPAHDGVTSAYVQVSVSSGGAEGSNNEYDGSFLERMFDERERGNAPPPPPPGAGQHLQYGELTPDEQIVALRAPQAHHYMSSSAVYDVVVDNLGAPPPDPFGYDPALDDPVQGDQQPPVVATGPNDGK